MRIASAALDTQKYEGNGPGLLSFVYFHGDLEHHVENLVDERLNGDWIDAPDLVILEEGPVEYGKSKHVIEGVAATAYVWKDKNGHNHGLVVADDDAKSIAYAEKCFEEKVWNL